MDSSVPHPGFVRASEAVVVGHSILQAASLGTVVAEYWSLGAPQQVELLQHGQNDWYRFRAANKLHAIRVLKCGLRTPAQLREEIDWSAALAAAGIATPAAMRTPRGAIGLEIAAPEGTRMICVYPWIEGRTLGRNLTIEDARAAGQLLAAIHGCGAGLPVNARRHSLGEKLARAAPTLDAALGDAQERDTVAAVRAGIASVLQQEPGLPAGSLHGDLHFGNLRRAADGTLYALDFDDCGLGALCVDLTPFIWRSRSENLDPSLDQAFLDGYQRLRPLSAPERQALPALLAARALYLASVLARDRNILGKVPGFDRPWPHYLQLAVGLLRAGTTPGARG